MISTCGAPVPSSSASSSSTSSASRMAPSPASSSTTSASSSTSIPSSTSIKIFRYSIIFSSLGCLGALQRGEWVDQDSSARLGEQITVQRKVKSRLRYYSKVVAVSYIQGVENQLNIFRLQCHLCQN